MSPQPTNYGNMPLEVSQTGSSQDGKKPTKFEENGKKFGKKMGNAGTFLEQPFIFGYWGVKLTLPYARLQRFLVLAQQSDPIL